MLPGIVHFYFQMFDLDGSKEHLGFEQTPYLETGVDDLLEKIASALMDFCLGNISEELVVEETSGSDPYVQSFGQVIFAKDESFQFEIQVRNLFHSDGPC